MKRSGSKTLEELGVLSPSGPRNAFQKHRPKSFTLAPTTPLTPAIMSLFDGQLPSEHYTINYIMQASPSFLLSPARCSSPLQEVVELWTAGEDALHDDDTLP